MVLFIQLDCVVVKMAKKVPLTLYALRVISIKLLLVISMLCKTEWS